MAQTAANVRPDTGAANDAGRPRSAASDAATLRRVVIEAGHEPKADRPRTRRAPKLKTRLFKVAIWHFGIVLRLLGIYGRGLRNALDIELTEIDLAFPDLPPAFDGYRLLHLSDLHIDSHPALAERLVSLLAEVEADLCVLTGDYRFHTDGGWRQILPAMETLVAGISARDGILVTLGNHDTAQMVAPFEALGMTVLMNRTVSLERGAERIHVIGVDDVHFFRTNRAERTLRTAPKGFRVALIHSPHLADEAAEEDVALYLTGHTHGGQICLPGGWPILTSSVARPMASGLWRHGKMIGYTSRGAGVSSLPVRFNCRGEITLFTLRRGDPDR